MQYFLQAFMEISRKGGDQLGFLLAQLGAHAAAKFAERLAPLNLKPSDAGILRFLKIVSGTSQQELSAKLGIHPSRLVAVLDSLEERSLLERRPNSGDRRQYSLHLTEKGNAVLQEIGRVARDHQEDLLQALDKAERQHLAELLRRVAEQQGLTPGVHPGYQWMRPGPSSR
jgi:DNA-binding MarR family transcriptional regulator